MVATLLRSDSALFLQVLVPLQPAPVHVPVVPPIQEETSKPADGATAVISERKRPESTWKLKG